MLNISYEDTDKDLVLPVIQRISQTYQTYSGRDRSRGLTQAVNYLEEQLSTLKIQAKKSMRSAQAFALSNGLGLQDGMPAAISAGSGGGGSGSVETSRETTQNKVNALKQQLTASRAAGAIRVYVAPQLEANTGCTPNFKSWRPCFKRKKVYLGTMIHLSKPCSAGSAPSPRSSINKLLVFSKANCKPHGPNSPPLPGPAKWCSNTVSWCGLPSGMRQQFRELEPNSKFYA